MPDPVFTTGFELRKVKFSISNFPKALLDRASMEVYVLMGTLRKVADDYISPEAEQEFQAKLFQTEPKLLCKYLLAKVHQWIRIIHKVHINSMFGSFFNNGSKYFLTDCKIIELDIRNPDILDKLKKGVPKRLKEAVVPIFNTKMIELQRIKQAKKQFDLLQRRRKRQMEKDVMMNNEETSLQRFQFLLNSEIKRYKSVRRSDLYTSYQSKDKPSAKNQLDMYRPKETKDWSAKRLSKLKKGADTTMAKYHDSWGRRPSKSSTLKRRLKLRYNTQGEANNTISFFGVKGHKMDHLLGIRKTIFPSRKFDSRSGGAMDTYFGSFFQRDNEIRKTHIGFKRVGNEGEGVVGSGLYVKIQKKQR